MEKLAVFETDKGHFAVRPIEWAGIWNADGKIQECGIRHTAIFATKEDAEWYANTKNAEEQGLLLRLPCKVGDTVYRINEGAKEPVIKMRVLQVHFKQLHKNRTIIRIDAINDNDMGESCYLLEDFGKTVFLTPEEAEQKLKEWRVK